MNIIMTNDNNIRQISTAPYEYLEEYQIIEQEFKVSPSSKYDGIYKKIQQLETRIANDLRSLEDYETNNTSRQNVYKQLTTDYSEMYRSIYAKLIIVGIALLIVARYIIYYIWQIFTNIPITVMK